MGSELLCRDDPGFSMEYVMLPDGTVRHPIDQQDWLFWTVMGRRIFGFYKIASTTIGEAKISTVFLGMDHEMGTGCRYVLRDHKIEVIEPDGYQPLIFETMVFGGPGDGNQRRYWTIEDARVGHRQMVARERRRLEKETR